MSVPISATMAAPATALGDIAPVTHEVLRKAEPDPERRPVIHAA